MLGSDERWNIAFCFPELNHYVSKRAECVCVKTLQFLAASESELEYFKPHSLWVFFYEMCFLGVQTKAALRSHDASRPSVPRSPRLISPWVWLNFWCSLCSEIFHCFQYIFFSFYNPCIQSHGLVESWPTIEESYDPDEDRKPFFLECISFINL